LETSYGPKASKAQQFPTKIIGKFFLLIIIVRIIITLWRFFLYYYLIPLILIFQEGWERPLRFGFFFPLISQRLINWPFGKEGYFSHWVLIYSTQKELEGGIGQPLFYQPFKEGGFPN